MGWVGVRVRVKVGVGVGVGVRVRARLMAGARVSVQRSAPSIQLTADGFLSVQ